MCGRLNLSPLQLGAFSNTNFNDKKTLPNLLESRSVNDFSTQRIKSIVSGELRCYRDWIDFIHPSTYNSRLLGSWHCSKMFRLSLYVSNTVTLSWIPQWGFALPSGWGIFHGMNTLAILPRWETLSWLETLSVRLNIVWAFHPVVLGMPVRMDEIVWLSWRRIFPISLNLSSHFRIWQNRTFFLGETSMEFEGFLPLSLSLQSPNMPDSVPDTPTGTHMSTLHFAVVWSLLHCNCTAQGLLPALMIVDHWVDSRETSWECRYKWSKSDCGSIEVGKKIT